MPVQTKRVRPSIEALDQRCLLAASLTASLHPISPPPAEVVVTRTADVAPMEQLTLNFAAVSGSHTNTAALDHVLTQLGPTGDVRLRRVIQDAVPSGPAAQHFGGTGTIHAAVSNIMKTKHD